MKGLNVGLTLGGLVAFVILFIVAALVYDKWVKGRI